MIDASKEPKPLSTATDAAKKEPSSKEMEPLQPEEPSDEIFARVIDSHITGDPPHIELDLPNEKGEIEKIVIPYSRKNVDIYLDPFRENKSGQQLVDHRNKYRRGEIGPAAAAPPGKYSESQINDLKRQYKRDVKRIPHLEPKEQVRLIQEINRADLKDDTSIASLYERIDQARKLSEARETGQPLPAQPDAGVVLPQEVVEPVIGRNLRRNAAGILEIEGPRGFYAVSENGVGRRFDPISFS